MLLSGATVSSRRAFVMIGLVLLARAGRPPQRVGARGGARRGRHHADDARERDRSELPDVVRRGRRARSPSTRRCGRVSRAWHAHAGALRRAGLYLFGIAFTTIVTTLATMPFTIYHFNRFPLYSVVANAVAVPITGFWVMPWAIVACLLMPLRARGAGARADELGHRRDRRRSRTRSRHGRARCCTCRACRRRRLVLLGFGGVWLCIWLARWRWLGVLPMAAGYARALPWTARPICWSPATSRAGRGARARRRLSAVDRRRAQRRRRDLDAPRRREPGAGLARGRRAPATARLRCDAARCLYRARGRVVALMRDGARARRGLPRSPIWW